LCGIRLNGCPENPLGPILFNYHDLMKKDALKNDTTATPHIAIIDDDPGVRGSMGMLLETRNWTFAEFERAGDFLDGAQPANFNCMVIDVRIPDMSGLELFEELNRRARSGQGYLPPALFLSGHGDIPMVVRALKQGAADFLEKPADHRTLLDAIGRALAADRIARSAHDSQVLLIREISELTMRERDVLTEIVAGYLSKQIAEHLNISTKTVETHRLRICHKFNVRTSMELAAKLRDVPPSLWQKS
jgi:two-component system response regulator DctR